jgi:hypothetical protein
LEGTFPGVTLVDVTGELEEIEMIARGARRCHLVL